MSAEPLDPVITTVPVASIASAVALDAVASRWPVASAWYAPICDQPAFATVTLTV